VTAIPRPASLLFRLLIVPVVLIVAVMGIVWLAIDYLAADYFMTLMKEYGVDATEVNAMFLEATHRALLLAGAAGLVFALVLSFLLTRHLLNPLTQMIHVTRALASGDYSARVQVRTTDEIGELGHAFNRMAQSLQQIERLRRTLLIDVAHELRTPLTNVRGYLEALKDGVLPPSRETFASLHDETIRLVTLVEGLLQLARAEAASLTLHTAPVHLEDLIDHGVTLFRARFESKRITVDVSTPDDRCAVDADRDKIAQAMHNLLDNAYAYTPEQGRVHLTLTRDNGEMTFDCSNSGDGIPTADLPFIFERLYRTEKSRSRERGGSGLGLAIVKELVGAHGGRVGASSSAGETHVWFTLPTITEPLPEPYGSLTSDS
jgi:signal transduction histidine kinase